MTVIHTDASISSTRRCATRASVIPAPSSFPPSMLVQYEGCFPRRREPIPFRPPVIPVPHCHSRAPLSFPCPFVIPVPLCHSREGGNPVLFVHPACLDMQ